ncbi:hypothetical protein FN846DRAFT_902367 [Sphaerosporella brunnea]|uniref:Uncharacterized protein n=1 Tax=Sphaerosporella brunnea TaxID=1250544 RepID=A0A5J5F9V3_9PEZI|nr:hypothetical protein FN846DRAFT_902367 [Sphaerosporella brunnea]
MSDTRPAKRSFQAYAADRDEAAMTPRPPRSLVPSLTSTSFREPPSTVRGMLAIRDGGGRCWLSGCNDSAAIDAAHNCFKYKSQLYRVHIGLGMTTTTHVTGVKRWDGNPLTVILKAMLGALQISITMPSHIVGRLSYLVGLYGRAQPPGNKRLHYDYDIEGDDELLCTGRRVGARARGARRGRPAQGGVHRGTTG